jgi:hypothetical protein
LRLPCTIRPAAVSLAAESPDKWFIFKRMNGAARGIRTPDLRITNAPLYQLSYCGPNANKRGLLQA